MKRPFNQAIGGTKSYRKYEKSHRWITFELDLRQANHQLWQMLGEIQSKCEHLAGAAVAPNVAQRLHMLSLARGALATTAIEGNTLTQAEVIARIEGKLTLPPSREYLGKEIDNICTAFDAILHRVQEEDGSISIGELCAYNGQVLANLPGEGGGELRGRDVTVGPAHRGAPAEDVHYLTNRLVDWLNDFDLPQDREIAFAVLKAIVAHLYIAWIHPFADGNGRTARLVEAKILLQAGVPSAAAHLLSNNYNDTRSEYYRQLAYASQPGGDVFPFISYAVRGLIDQLRTQIDDVRTWQLDVVWTNYIYERFKGLHKAGDIRRRDLLLEISQETKPVDVHLSDWPREKFARLYGRKTARTVVRDFAVLAAQDLIVLTGEGYIVNKTLLQALLPVRKTKQ
jgi:Fic family protein